MNTMIKMLCAGALCLGGLNVAQAATHQTTAKAKSAKTSMRAGSEEARQLAVCAKKSQGTPVMYSYGGVTFNGYCQTNENGKMQFMPPMPTGQTAEAAPTTM